MVFWIVFMLGIISKNTILKAIHNGTDRTSNNFIVGNYK